MANQRIYYEKRTKLQRFSKILVFLWNYNLSTCLVLSWKRIRGNV